MILTVGDDSLERSKYKKRAEIRIRRNLSKYERLGDVLLALEDLLKDNPETEKSELVGQVDDKAFRVIRTDPDFNAPGVTLLYYEEEYVVWIWAIKIDPPDDYL